ncbi:hypothetical protein EXIGLDRAFT_104997 [Exidia glandulosa HHB12029]|uniref:Uncharacterized protein n=1 Tax=Exidia glandulosa HHB12029 TaxID=1314781 RepID=A0A165GW73_EXIGL|nr:hypothetical protein EXIGLDRAFT_104997 [Exidia glandulosa HHB12029]
MWPATMFNSLSVASMCWNAGSNSGSWRGMTIKSVVCITTVLNCVFRLGEMRGTWQERSLRHFLLLTLVYLS